MLRARALLAACLNLAPVRHVAPNASDVLVVDFADVVHAELADLAPGRVPPASAPTRAGAAIIAASSAACSWPGPKAGAAWGLGTTVIRSWRDLLRASLIGHG